MTTVPKHIRRVLTNGKGTALEITWSDGRISSIDSTELRKACPCAVCNEKRGDTSHAKPLTPGRAMLTVLAATKDEETNLEKVWAVGNYAVGMRWADAHDSGIYTFRYLAEICDSRQ